MRQISIYVATRHANDPPGTLRSTKLVKAGEAAYKDFTGTGSSAFPFRAGDYSGISVDPANGLSFWAASEYATFGGSENWGTWITQFYAPPLIVNIVPPANGVYNSGDVLQFTVEFDQPVVVDSSGGTPQLQVHIGATTRFATYVSGSGTNMLLFSYTVQTSDYDNNGIQLVSPLVLNGGRIDDTSGNPALLGFTPP
jgi:hypothetical protein